MELTLGLPCLTILPRLAMVRQHGFTTWGDWNVQSCIDDGNDGGSCGSPQLLVAVSTDRGWLLGLPRMHRMLWWLRLLRPRMLGGRLLRLSWRMLRLHRLLR